ncbi:MAG: T9SS type B sorting domain-containing protein [Sphingobacteriales bacterium]|nr:MAG: T9SS type B sorting domain-containing protein [Sphingobacteriales bacterium]
MTALLLEPLKPRTVTNGTLFISAKSTGAGYCYKERGYLQSIHGLLLHDELYFLTWTDASPTKMGWQVSYGTRRSIDKRHFMKMSNTKILLSFLTLLLGSFTVKAQVNVNDNVTATQLVQTLVGTGISFSNPILICGSKSAGEFQVINSNLGIGDGIVMSTGYVKTDAATGQIGVNGGQANYFPATCINETGPDPDLDGLVTVGTHDRCVLEFDFVPDGDSLLFDYVFGSEEYDGFSCSSFNDVFGFFLSGPGITGNPNIALIPGTNIPVAINSTTNPAITQPGGIALCQAMGAGSPFAQYYNDNSAGSTITFYGMTTVLTARAAVIPCTTYHIKLAIADGGDCTLDSGVFLEANSFRSTNIKLIPSSSLGSNYPYLVEGCTQSTVTVKRSTAFPVGQTVHLSYSGGAIRNTDYNPVPDSITIPAGDTVITFTIIPIQDGIEEGFEYITLNILNPCNGIVLDSVRIPVYDYLPYTMLTDDTAMCAGQPVRLEVDGDTTFTWFWRSNPPNSKIANPGAILTRAFPDTTTTFYVSATLGGCVTDTSEFTATVEPIPVLNIMRDTALCLHAPLEIKVDVGPDYFSNYTYLWFTPENLSDPFVKEPEFWIENTSGSYTYVLAAQTPLGCTGRDTFTVVARPAVDLVDVSPNFTAKYGDVVQLTASGAPFFVWTPDRLLDFPNIADPRATATDTATFQVIGMNQWGCADTAYVKMDIDYSMFEIVPNAFSPNGDGRNDEFRISSMKFQRLLEFRVFNRWGQEVFSTTDYKKGWDGSYKGTQQEAGVYQYLIRVTTPDGKQRMYKGDVTLIR